jgi:hypothetical protein
VRFSNVYGIDIPTRTELIAHNRTEAEIAAVLGNIYNKYMYIFICIHLHVICINICIYMYIFTYSMYIYIYVCIHI